MADTVIRLPLNSAIKRYLTSGNYDGVVQQALGQLDLLYTYIFRYPRLLSVDIARQKNTQGFAIDFTSAHPGVGVTVTALFLAVSLGNVISDYKKRQEDDEKNAGVYQETYNRVKKQLRKSELFKETVHKDSVLKKKASQGSGTSVPPAIASNLEKEAENKRRVELNTFLNKILNEMPEAAEFKKKYQRIEITASGYVNLVKQPPANKEGFLKKTGRKLSAMAAATWEGVGLASFVYWIMWMGWGVLTGNFSPAGIGSFGMSGFIIPLVIGALYPLIKMGNWLRNRYSKKETIQGKSYHIEPEVQQKLDAATDLSRLLHRVIYAKQKARLEKELTEAGVKIPVTAPKVGSLETDKKILRLGKHSWLQSAATFVAVTVGSFIGAQYAAWIVTDILKVAANISLSGPGFALGFGAAFMICSGLYGIYQAYQKYHEVEKHRLEAEKVGRSLNQHKQSLEKIYDNKCNKINQLIKEIGALTKKPGDLQWLAEQVREFGGSKLVETKRPPKPPKTAWTTLQEIALHAYAFLGGATAGVMIGRLATVAGTGVFLPFAAAVLSNPYTIAIIVGCGLVYGVFKAYQAYQQRKEARAKALLEERQEKISCLQQQVEVADLEIEVLQAKKASLVQEKAGEPSQKLTRSASFVNLSPLSKQSLFKGGSVAALEEGDKPLNKDPVVIVSAAA